MAPIKQPPYLNSVSGKNFENTETTRVKMLDTNCIGCGQCVTNCTAGAITPVNRLSEIEVARTKGKVIIAVLAPATRVGLSEMMGMPCGASCEAQLVDNLKKAGFNYVFDNQWAADACTIEDAKEVIKAKDKHPVFTSCCPAWINLVETRYPDLIPLISTAKSPTGIICAVIKRFFAKQLSKKPEDLFIVGMMPCTAKKIEAARDQLKYNSMPECDLSITTREVAELLQSCKFSVEREAELKQRNQGRFDQPFATSSGAAYIFGRTGGVAESVVRFVAAKSKKCSVVTTKTIWELPDKSQSIKLREFIADEVEWKAVVSHGGAAAEELVKIYKAGMLEVDCVEVMMCPQGCQNGGGQPKLNKKSLILERVKGLNLHDYEDDIKNCTQNEEMLEYVKKNMPTEHDIHEVMHTSFKDRKTK